MESFPGVGVVFIWPERLGHQASDLDDKVRVLVGQISGFPGIGLEIVEFDGILDPDANGFPVADSKSLLEGLSDMPIVPIEVFVVPGLRLAEQRRQHRDPVDGFGHRQAGELGEGRENIPERENLIRSLPCGNSAWPAGNERDPDAAFIEVALAAAEGAVALKKLHGNARVKVGAVVGGENDQRVGFEAEISEAVAILPTSASMRVIMAA